MAVSKEILQAMAQYSGFTLSDDRVEVLAVQLENMRKALKLADELDLTTVEPAIIFIPAT